MNGPIVLRIKADSSSQYVRKVAGALAWRLRDDGYCNVRAIKQDAVNTAIKSVAIVNEWVAKHDIRFCIDTMFDTSEKDSTAISFTVNEADSIVPPNVVHFRVCGKDSAPDSVEKLATAMTATMRSGAAVELRCIGASAVYRGVLACTIMKGKLFSCGKQAMVVPTWTTINDTKPISAIRMTCWSKGD